MPYTPVDERKSPSNGYRPVEERMKPLGVGDLKTQVVNQLPLNPLAKTEINADLDIDNEKAVVDERGIREGYYQPRGGDWSRFIHQLPFLSDEGKRNLQENTAFIGRLDKANVRIDPLAKNPKTVMAHELFHHAFEKSPMGPTFVLRESDITNKNAEFFGTKFLNEWDTLSEKYTVLKDIDKHIAEHYPTENMAPSDKATERFAYLGQRVMDDGIDVIPPKLRKYYRSVLDDPVIPVRRGEDNFQLHNDDLDELAAVLYGEISNRSSEKRKLEARTIAGIALNRMKEKGKSMTEVLGEKNQFQAFGGEQYKKYRSGEARKNELDKKKAEIVDEIIEELRGGDLSNKQYRALGGYYYIHHPDGSIEIDPKRPLIAKKSK